MNTHTMLYRRLLRLYPTGVQREFADEMALVFSDSIEQARGRGRSAVVMTWLRELRSLPGALLQSHGTVQAFDRKTLVIAALVLLTVSNFTSRLVANLGLFHTISWILLGLALTAGGILFGAGLRRTAGAVLLFALLGPMLVDRALLSSLETRQSLVAPGVRADAYLAPSDAAADSFIRAMQASRTRRVRTTARLRGEQVMVTAVRSGGVDGTYLGLTMILLIGSAAAGRRFAIAT